MIELNIKKQIFNESFYPLLLDYAHRFEVYMGSAGSGKSYFIALKLVIRAINEQIRILVCRRYGTTIRLTVFSLFKDIIKLWKLLEYIKVNESDYRIKFPNGSEIIFTGLDEETKLLSLNDIGTVWIEEAYEVPQDMVEQLNLRMRGKNESQLIIMSFNPISLQSWLYDFCTSPPESFIFHHSTYKDNKFLSQDYIATLEELRVRNPLKARIFCDGEWGIDTDGLVLTNWVVEEFDNITLAKSLEHRAGMDFGYQDPSAIVDSLYDEANKIIYVCNEFYKTGQTLDELYNAVIGMQLLKSRILCDSAEPRTIEYFKRKNINAVPCIKGLNSVEARISFLQNHKIVVNPKCTNVINELSNFSYIKDNKTNKFTNKMTHEFSHSIDALGYAYSDIYAKGKLKTISKGVLGL